MSDEHDDYLWTGRGAAPAEVAALERELQTLAWTPRPLAFPAAARVVPLHRDDDREQPARATDDRSRWAPLMPLMAALAAAAAVLAVIAWLRSPDDAGREPDATTVPAVQPTGRPTSPDLKDPFADQEVEQSPSVAPTLVDPFGQGDPQPRPRRRVSPDLKDPFANAASSTTPAPPAPITEPHDSNDLVDPFAGSEGERQNKQRKPGKLHDPFSGKQVDPPSKQSPDLKDPFKR